MLSAKKILKVAREWNAMAILGKKRFSCRTLVADKGHFVLYTCEGKRFMLPIAFLKSNVFEELLEKAEEEFGLPQDRPITLPCDAAFLEQVLSLLKKGAMEDGERIGFNLSAHCITSSMSDLRNCQHLVVF